MASTFPAPIRWLERIFQNLSTWVNVPIQGSQRSRSRLWATRDDSFSLRSREYDLEISEYPIRDPYLGRALIEMTEHCPEVSTALDIICGDVFSSADGDDQGWAIADYLDHEETQPIDPQVKQILDRLFDEVIGQEKLEFAVERMLSYGDAFASIGVNPKTQQIDRILPLPTWEVFRVENNFGELMGFEQRRSISFEKEEEQYSIHPLLCTHWRYRRKNLYGRALFKESIEDWQSLKDAMRDLRIASRSIGVNPTIHIMPDGSDENYRRAYKEAYEARKKQGIVADFYVACGGDMKKLSSSDPDLKALLDYVALLRQRIAMRSRLPLWKLGFSADAGSKDIATQPALDYVRFINKVRMDFSEGVRHLCDLELALHDIPKTDWQYRIVFPKLSVNPWEDVMADESDESEIEDLG